MHGKNAAAGVARDFPTSRLHAEFQESRERMNIGRYIFEGPFSSINQIRETSGIYAVICSDGSKQFVVDIGSSGQLKTRLANHERRDCWLSQCHGILAFAILYTPNYTDDQRTEIESELRKQYDPRCGKQ